MTDFFSVGCIQCDMVVDEVQYYYLPCTQSIFISRRTKSGISKCYTNI